MDDKFIQKRINDLRIKNISEYQLSLESGHSQGYIQAITSGRNLPSMSAFLDIRAYFDITPSEFFNPSINNPSLVMSQPLRNYLIFSCISHISTLVTVCLRHDQNRTCIIQVFLDNYRASCQPSQLCRIDTITPA